MSALESETKQRDAALPVTTATSARPVGAGFGTLAGLARRPAAGPQCEVCATALAHEHSHLFEPRSHQILCVCAACALTVAAGAGSPYRRVGDRVRRLADFKLSDALWDALMIPVGMAFFFDSSAAGRVVAFYPGPAGVTESLLEMSSWSELATANPILATMPRDVEALLVNRTNASREYYLVPIDNCY
jgi:hypothetical protein